eukprot:488858-Rhodomonas_salina.1
MSPVARAVLFLASATCVAAFSAPMATRGMFGAAAPSATFTAPASLRAPRLVSWIPIFSARRMHRVLSIC